jgi:hypothetical protein
MESKDDFKEKSRRKHSSHSREPYLGIESRNGAPIRCQFCPCQSFRRSSLRSQDLTEILLMRYPVRCLRCSQRQMVSFTVAGISISSSIKIKKRSSRSSLPAHWKDPFKERGGDQAASSTAPDC